MKLRELRPIPRIIALVGVIIGGVIGSLAFLTFLYSILTTNPFFSNFVNSLFLGGLILMIVGGLVGAGFSESAHY